MHKIVVLSDLYWDNYHRSISDGEVYGFTIDKLSSSRYFYIRKYAALIMDEKPTLVLLAGDLTGDGSCGHGYHNAVKILLLVLESQGVTSLLISGNHDEPQYYDQVATFVNDLEYAHEISGMNYHHQGLSIVGVSYDLSNDKRKLKKIISDHKGATDIVVAHSPLKRRPWLFDFESKAIFTGHFDQKLTAIDGQIFVSLNNNYHNDFTYATLHMDCDKVVTSYKFVLDNMLVSFEEPTDNLVGDKIKPFYLINEHKIPIESEVIRLTQGREINLIDLRGVVLKAGVQLMRSAKKEGNNLLPAQVSMLTSKYVYKDFRFSKTMIKDYLGAV